MTRRDRRPGQTGRACGTQGVSDVDELLLRLMLDATGCIAPGKVAEMAVRWIERAGAGPDEVSLMTTALAMATNLALFTPSASGSTAFDRLARQRRDRSAPEAALLEAVRRARFRLLRVETAGERARLRDLVSAEVVTVADAGFPAATVGVTVAGWLARWQDAQVFFGAVTPLDEAAVAVATGFLPPGRTELVNPLRCAETIYQHIVRCGTIEIPGLNSLDDDDLFDEGNALDDLAARWAEPDEERDAEDVQFVRSQSGLGEIVDVLASVCLTRAKGLGALSDAYAAIALLQIETVQRRAAVGSGTLRVETVAAAIGEGLAAGRLPPGTGEAFAEIRRRLGTAPGGAKDAELDRLLGRIRALRAKTVEQGCTEQEALTAAAKVAQLLDRYGLSLSELDLRRQGCDGVAVETDRKRMGPIDDCVPAVAAFFDCRVWSEKSAAGMLRYVFFGLPSDVVAARYLHDLVAHAFETETGRFRDSDGYRQLRSGERRTATNSFQIGLARGIAAKLDIIRREREERLRRSSGRDLVVTKSDLVETELASLGLSLRKQNRSGQRRVLVDAFEEGREAGLGFEYTEGIEHAA